MYKLNALMPLLCGIIVTLALASGAAGGDKAVDYLKEGKLKQRIDLVNNGLLSDGLGRTGSYVVVEADGSWAAGTMKMTKREELKTGKLTEKQLSQLAKALAQHNLANLPNQSGQAKFGETLTITFGKKSVSLSGGRPDSKKLRQVFDRYAGIESALRKLTLEAKTK